MVVVEKSSSCVVDAEMKRWWKEISACGDDVRMMGGEVLLY